MAYIFQSVLTKTITVDIPDSKNVNAYILDEENDMKFVKKVFGKSEFILDANSVLFLCEE